MRLLALCLLSVAPAFAVDAVIGIGCTTATMIDKDCDGYGVGSPLGMDADDNDATVNTPASMISKYGTLANFLSTVKGYNPTGWVFLATTGNDSTCVRSTTEATAEAAPCATWATAYTKHSAGDAIVVRGGTWSIAANYNIGRAGTTADHPDILMGYPGEKPILDHSSLGWYGLAGQLAAVTYTIFDGLTIANSLCPAGQTQECGAAGIDIRTGGTYMRGIVVRNMEISNYKWGIVAIAAQDGTLIEDSLIHDNYEHPIYTGVNDNDANGSDSIQTNLIVRRNLLFNGGRDGFHNNGRCNGCLLHGNIIYDNNLALGSSSGAPAIQMQQGWNHSTVSNNVVLYGSSAAFLFDDYDETNPASAGIYPHDQNYNLIINNTFIFTGRDNNGHDNSTSGFSVVGTYNRTTTDHDMGHNTWANNIFVQGSSTAGAHNSVVRYSKHQVTDSDWLSTDTWTNNILYASNGAAPLAIAVYNASTDPYQMGTSQDWAYFQSHAGTFTNNSQANPLLTAWNPAWYATPGSYNLALQTGSPAINAGTATGAPATDIRGVTRSNPDIGAYEYVSAGTPPTITSTSPLTSGTVGVAYSLQFTASGDVPITWTYDGVPGGLTFTSGGLLSGTPTTPGTSTINVIAANAAGSAGPTGFSLTNGAAAGAWSQATGRMTGTIK